MIKIINSTVRQHKLLSFFLLTILVSLVILIASPRARTGPFGIGLPSDYKVFTSKQGGFAVEYPENWVAVETPQGSHGDMEVVAAILVPGRSFPQVYFATKLFSDSNLDSVVAWGESRAMIYSDYTESSISRVETPNVKGVIREFKWKSATPFGKVGIWCKDLYVINGSTGYAISFCARERDLDQFESVVSKMISSFTLTNNQN